MGQEAERADRVHHDGRGERVDELEHQRKAAQHEAQAHHAAHHEGDDLVAGQRRDARADGEERAGHQQAAEIAGEDDAVVGIAEVVDGDPEREGERQRDCGEYPGGEELPHHRLRHGHGQGEQELDGARPALLRPQPHRERGDQEQVEPGVELEEGLEVGLPTPEEVADVEGEDSAQEHEDGEEDVGDGSAEVAGELPPADGPDVSHRARPPCRW